MSPVWLVVIGLALSLVLVARRLHRIRARDAAARGRFAAVLESLSAGLSVWNGERRLVACNGRFREFYPTVELKPGLLFEDLIRFTVTRGLVQVPEAEIDTWVTERGARFREAGHDVLRTAGGRWLEIRRVPADQDEVIVLYTDVTATRDAELTQAEGDDRRDRHAAALRLLRSVLRVAADAGSVEVAVERVVSLVCGWSGWPVGHAYRVSADDPDRLAPMGIWHLSDPDAFAALRAGTDRAQLHRGEGLSGQALRSGDVVWIANVSVDPRVTPERRAEMTGIRGACAVPITSRSGVVGVLEFLAREQLGPESSATELLRAIGAVLGQAFEHRDTQVI